MTARSFLALALVAASPAHSLAQQQHAGSQPRAQSTAPGEARQFDFLIGQWELTVRPKVSGLAAKIHGAPKLLGTWKAWRAFDGFGVEDELRIVDASGNPSSLSHALRSFDAGTKQWTQAVLDVYRGRVTTSTAQWADGEMVVRSQGTDQEGRPTLMRTRFHDITPTAFKYQSDRSIDAGKTWETAVLRIEARRVAATAPR